MRNKKILFLITGLFVTLAIVLGWSAIYRPHKVLKVGMSHAEMQRSTGRKCELIPLGSALSSPTAQKDLEEIPMYLVEFPFMATDVFLNSYKKVIFIDFLFGPDAGSKRVLQIESPAVREAIQ
jgi:hypothetical protein